MKIKLSASTDGQLKDKLRMPLKVSDNYFVEGNLSAQGIITRVQLALKTFKIFDSLFLKYK